MQTHQGRWGYYPCSYEQFQQLKQFHLLVFQDRRLTKRQQRWEAKREDHRRGPRPDCFGTNHDYYAWILQEYRNARHPQATAEAVKPLDLPSDWEVRLEQFRLAYQHAA